MIVDLNLTTYSVKTLNNHHVEFISCPAQGQNGSTIRRCVVTGNCICLLLIQCECMSHKASCSSHQEIKGKKKKKLAVQFIHRGKKASCPSTPT